MNKNLNIIQFMPYFPPHRGGLETVGEEIGINWVKNDLGKFINVVTDFNQPSPLTPLPRGEGDSPVVFQGEIIGYKKNNIIHLVIPSFEIINNFPMYKFWDKKTKLVFEYLKEMISPYPSEQPSPQPSEKPSPQPSEQPSPQPSEKPSPQPSPLEERGQIQGEEWLVISHTRFFLTSLFGGLYSKKKKLKWIHIEHGSDYVKLSSKLNSFLSFIYDKIFGKWVFKNADIVLGISQACRDFILNEFVNREVKIFYRGLDIPKNSVIIENLKEKFNNKKIVGYVGRLYKWKNVESLIKAYFLLDNDLKSKLQLVIVGDGEDFERLKLLDPNNEIYFTGGKSFDEALAYQKQFDIHVHPSSPGGGLATTLLQAMYFGCYIVATPNEGAKEVIQDGVNGIMLRNDSVEELKRGIELALEKYDCLEEYSNFNRKVIEEKFSWDGNIISLYNLIK